MYSLFAFQSGVPVSYRLVSSKLHQAIKFIGLNPSPYLGQSFCIGAATKAANNGMSEYQIQQLGRWHPQAFERYIRINSFHPNTVQKLSFISIPCVSYSCHCHRLTQNNVPFVWNNLL
jgi:hypothetical protein